PFPTRRRLPSGHGMAVAPGRLRARLPLRLRALAGDRPALPGSAATSGAAPRRFLSGNHLRSVRRGAAVPAGRRAGAGVEHRGADPGARRRPGGYPERDGSPRPQASRVAGPGATPMTMREALRGHWPEYATEAAGLGA